MSPFDSQHRSRDRASVHAAWDLAASGLFVFALILLAPAARADSLWATDTQGARSMLADRKARVQGEL